MSNGFDPSVESQLFDPLQPYLGYQQGMGDVLASMGQMAVTGNEDGAGGSSNARGGVADFGDWWGQTGSAQGGWGI